MKLFNLPSITLKLSVWMVPLVPLLSKPYLGHYFVPHDLMAGLSILFLIGFAFKYIRYEKTDIVFLSAWILCGISHIIFALVQTFILENSDYMALRGAIGHGSKIIFIIVAIPVIKKAYSSYVWKINTINVLIISMSIFLFCSLAAGLNIPNWVIPKRPDINIFYLWNEHLVLGATNVLRKYSDITIIRIAGFCNEPGTLALILTYLMVLNEFSFKSVRLRGFYLIAGILTFSLAFIISLLFFIFYWFVESRKKFIYALSIFFLISSLPIAYDYLPQSGFKKFIDTKLIKRFEYDPKTGTIKGDNRTRSVLKSNAIREFKKNPTWGLGAREAKNRGASGANIAGELARYGVFGIVMFYLPFYILALRFWGTRKSILIFILFINFFQRPGMHEMFTMLMITSFYFADHHQKSYRNSALPFMSRLTQPAKILFFKDQSKEILYAR